MSYYPREIIDSMGFLHVGQNVKISTKASVYDCERITLGDNSRIDDFCVISGLLTIGSFVHITPHCLIAGGEKGIQLEDFTTIAYGARVFSQTDDYSGETMTNSLIPKRYKNEFKSEVIVKKYSIVGAGAIIFPGVTLEEGTAIGSMSLVRKSTEAWGIYAGVPARRIKNRKKNLLELANRFKMEAFPNDPI